jgi:hypothetical protein
VVNSYVLGPNFDLKTLRKDNAKRFFDMNRADSTSSVAALEDNFEFVLQLAVTYAPDGFLSTSFSVQGVFGMFARYSQDKGTCVHICIMYVSLVCCQAVFRNIADTYGIFNDGTMRRVTKETLHANKQGIIQTLHVNKQGKTQQVKRPANYFCVCVCVSGLGFFYCWPSPEHGNACLISGWKVRRIKARQNKFKQVYI